MQSAIFSANIIPSLFAPWHWANILGLQKSERSGKPNCVSFAFECFVRVALIILQFYNNSKVSLGMFIAVFLLHFQGLVLVP